MMDGTAESTTGVLTGSSHPGNSVDSKKSSTCVVVDLSNRGLNKLEPNVFESDAQALVLDNNNIIKLENFESCSKIEKLSVASNRLVRMMEVSKLRNLRQLNLPCNSIGYVEGLKDLVHLEWLNLAGNNLKGVDGLSCCIELRYLDLSDNSITFLGDLTKLTHLQTLHLHGNTITTLHSAPAAIPSNVKILSLDENEIGDLNEISYLASVHSLEQLSLAGNPCVILTLSMCDYRPYVLCWCVNVKVLDGYTVSPQEEHMAECIRHQGKIHSFCPGQHDLLLQYLTSIFPLGVGSATDFPEPAFQEIFLRQTNHSSVAQTFLHGHFLHSPVIDSTSLKFKDTHNGDDQISPDHSYLPLDSASWKQSPCTAHLNTESESLESTAKLAITHLTLSSSDCKHSMERDLRMRGQSPELDDHMESVVLVPEKQIILNKAAVRIQAWWRGHWMRRCSPKVKEVRTEIRLRRMQEHITYLNLELKRMTTAQEEERLKRVVQEEALSFVWKQLQSLTSWRSAVMQQIMQPGSVLPFSLTPAIASSASNEINAPKHD